MKERKKSSKRRKSRKKHEKEIKIKKSSKFKLRLALVLIILTIFYYIRLRKLSTTTRISTVTDEDEPIPPMIIPESSKKKKKKIIDPNKNTWDLYQPKLITKKTMKECKANKISPQITNPLVYVNKNDKSVEAWKRRAFSCISKCSDSQISEFKSRYWKYIKVRKDDNLLIWDSTFVILSFKKLKELAMKEKESFNELVFHRETVTYLNTLLTSDMLFSNPKSTDLTKKQLETMKYDKIEFKDLETLLSSEHRSKYVDIYGNTINSDKECIYSNFNIDQISNSKNKFITINNEIMVVKAHLLVASNYPFMVFGKLSHVIGNKRKKILPLDEFQKFLSINRLTGSQYVNTFLNIKTKKIMLLLFHSVRQDIIRRRGSYLYLTVDLKITTDFDIFLDKITPNSDLTTDILDKEYTEGLDLVQELQEIPVVFNSMVKGDKYGSWELLFTEIQESCEQITYNPCNEFIDELEKDKEDVNLKKVNNKISKVHKMNNRLKHEENRVAKKKEEQKKEMCRNNKLSYPSNRCDKKHEELRNVKFNEMFKIHEKSFNPNQFQMPLPGQVFPWEKV